MLTTNIDVSVITPTFNCARFLSETIDSVLAQTFSDWELILIDDDSTDNTLVVIEKYLSLDKRIKLIKLDDNLGTAVARNVGIKAAEGRYIAFLDSDDVWFPNKLEQQLMFMEKTKSAFSYTAYDKIDEEGRLKGHVGVPARVSYDNMLRTCYIGCLTVIIDTDYLGQIAFPLIRKRQDYGLWLKLLKHVEYAEGLDKSLAKYRVHSNSISANKLKTALYTWRLYRRIERLSLFKSSYYFLHYMLRGVLRNKFPSLARKLGVLR